MVLWRYVRLAVAGECHSCFVGARESFSTTPIRSEVIVGGAAKAGVFKIIPETNLLQTLRIVVFMGP